MEALIATSELPATAESWQSMWGLGLVLLVVLSMAVRGLRRIWRKP
jgi:hypothetical protein